MMIIMVIEMMTSMKDMIHDTVIKGIDNQVLNHIDVGK